MATRSVQYQQLTSTASACLDHVKSPVRWTTCRSSASVKHFDLRCGGQTRTAQAMHLMQNPHLENPVVRRT